jgi:hypothetical protein
MVMRVVKGRARGKGAEGHERLRPHVSSRCCEWRSMSDVMMLVGPSRPGQAGAAAKA